MDRTTLASHRIFGVAEAWVHHRGYEEEECSPEQIEFLNTIYYKGFIADNLNQIGGNIPDEEDEKMEENDEAPADNNLLAMAGIGKLGYSKFSKYITQLRRQGGNAILETITQGHVLWYYNHSTLTQIFFRIRPRTINRQLPRSLPISRNFDQPFYELQMDILSYTTPNKKESEMRGSFQSQPIFFLVMIDPATRYAFIRKLKTKTAQSVATALVQSIPASIQSQVRRLRSDAGPEYGRLMVWLKEKGWNFPNPVTSNPSEESPVDDENGDNEDDVEPTGPTRIERYGGMEYIRINKAGSMLSGARTSPSTLAPVETMIRTTRELIEQYRRTGYTSGRGWDQEVSRLLQYYNNTVHSAFQNRFTPYEAATQEDVRREFGEKNRADRSEGRDDIEDHILQPGDFVRIIRRSSAGFAKQSLPYLSYDVYRVKDSYGGSRSDWIHVPLERVRQVSREQRGLYEEETREPKVDNPEPIHHSRLARVKTFEVNGRSGQTIDPPADTRWDAYFAEIDSRTFTQRQTIEGDFYLKPGTALRKRRQRQERHMEGDIDYPAEQRPRIEPRMTRARARAANL